MHASRGLVDCATRLRVGALSEDGCATELLLGDIVCRWAGGEVVLCARGRLN